MTDTSESPAPTDNSATAESAADAAKHARRARGAAFPAIPLSEAVALAKKIEAFGVTHTNAAVASFLGHSTANSGPYRSKIAALKDYELLTGRGDDLTVTPLALEILHPGLDADTQSAMRAAFRKVKLFTTVYDATQKDRELPVDQLGNSAMHNHGVATQAKEAFATVFVKSGEAAGLIEVLDAGHIRIPSIDAGAAAEGGDEVDPDEFAANQNDGGLVRRDVPAPRISPRETTNAVVNHSWPIDGGEISFIVQSSKTLPATAYSVIGAVIEAGDKLAVMLAPETADGEATDPA